jgi:hypothetical protein
MAISNHERVGKSLELLKDGFPPYVEREMKAQHARAALSYNSLVQSWPEIIPLSRDADRAKTVHGEMFT